MTPVAPIANWALDVKPIRVAMESPEVDKSLTFCTARLQAHLRIWFKHTPLPGSGTRGR